MFKIIGALLSISVLLSAQQPSQGLFVTKAVFEERSVWDSAKGNIRTMLPATKVQKNSILVYVNQLTNHSKETKGQIAIDNPIPYSTSYVPNTASCEGNCKIYYSIDGGKSFKKPEELFVVYGERKRVALGSEYTHIKFIFPQLVPYQKVRMGFKSSVK